jgi:hypothetical protein
MDKWRDSTGYRAANATPHEFRDVLLRIASMANTTMTCREPQANG